MGASMLDLEHKMIHSYSFQSLHIQRVKAIAAILWPGYNCQLSGRYPLWQFVGPRRHLENSLDISPAYPQISLVAAQLFWKCHPIHLWKTSHHSLVPNWGSKMRAQSQSSFLKHMNRIMFVNQPLNNHTLCSLVPMFTTGAVCPPSPPSACGHSAPSRFSSQATAVFYELNPHQKIYDLILFSFRVMKWNKTLLKKVELVKRTCKKVLPWGNGTPT